MNYGLGSREAAKYIKKAQHQSQSHTTNYLVLIALLNKGTFAFIFKHLLPEFFFDNGMLALKISMMRERKCEVICKARYYFRAERLTDN